MYCDFSDFISDFESCVYARRGDETKKRHRVNTQKSYTTLEVNQREISENLNRFTMAHSIEKAPENRCRG